MSKDEPYNVLIICYANVCRSPMAQMIFTALLERRFVWESQNRWNISSAGINVGTPGPMHPLARVVLDELEIIDPGFQSRQLTDQLINEADLILTSDREQRALIVRKNPKAIQRTFTIRQFGRLCAAGHLIDDVQVSSGRDLENLAVSGQSLIQRVEPEDDEIPDPIGADIKMFRYVADLLIDNFEQMLG